MTKYFWLLWCQLKIQENVSHVTEEKPSSFSHILSTTQRNTLGKFVQCFVVEKPNLKHAIYWFCP